VLELLENPALHPLISYCSGNGKWANCPSSDKSLSHIDIASFCHKSRRAVSCHFLRGLQNRIFLQFTGRRANESEQHGTRLGYDMISNLWWCDADCCGTSAGRCHTTRRMLAEPLTMEYALTRKQRTFGLVFSAVGNCYHTTKNSKGRCWPSYTAVRIWRGNLVPPFLDETPTPGWSESISSGYGFLSLEYDTYCGVTWWCSMCIGATRITGPSGQFNSCPCILTGNIQLDSWGLYLEGDRTSWQNLPRSQIFPGKSVLADCFVG